MHYIYGLASSAQPLQIRYVGRAAVPDMRLMAHLGLARRGKGPNPVLRAWINQTESAGAQVQLRVFGKYQSGVEVSTAETRWIRFWSNYCELANIVSMHVWPGILQLERDLMEQRERRGAVV